MSLRLGDTAPDFSAESSEGRIDFHQWLGPQWGVLFSHPRDFTPVCTTELGYVARLKPEFQKRGVKAIGLSIDPVDSHKGWLKDIQETQGHAVNFPIIADPDRKVAKAAAEFQADLKEEFAPSIDSYLYSLNDDRADWFSIFFLGPLWTYILQHAENRQRQQEALDRLFAGMAGCIVVVPR